MSVMRQQMVSEALGRVDRRIMSIRPSDTPDLVYLDDIADKMLELLNNERAQHNLTALKLHPALMAAAQGHSDDQARQDHINHYGSDGSTWADRCAAAGYPGADLTNVRENVAAGQNSPEQAVGDWMGSPGHRDAILDPNIVHLGVGVATGASNWMYWTCDMCHGAPDPEPPKPEPEPGPYEIKFY